MKTMLLTFFNRTPVLLCLMCLQGTHLLANQTPFPKHFADTTIQRDTTVVRSDNRLQTALDRKIDSFVQLFFTETNSNQLAIGVLDNSHSVCLGYARVDTNRFNIPSPKTIFEIGSLTKTFAATLLAKYILAGKVKADDPVSLYLPDSVGTLQYKGKSITLQQLANHTSGLPRLPLNMFVSADMSNPYKAYTTAQLFSWLKSYNLTRQPGLQYEYSNLGMGLIGIVLERISGQTFETLVLENICKPLKMKSTRQHVTDAETKLVIAGYDALGKQTSAWDFKSLVAAGGLRSTIYDMLLFTKAQMSQSNKKWNKAMQLTHQITFEDSSNNSVGLGWHVFRIDQANYLGHEGKTGGFSSIVIFNEKTKNGVTVLVNGDASPGKVAIQILQWLDKDQQGKP